MRVLSALSHPSPWPTAALSPSHGFGSSSHSSSSSPSSPPHLISSLHKNSPFCLRGLDPKPVFLSTTHSHRYFVTIASNRQGPAKLYSAFPTSPALVSSVNDLFEFICSGPLMKKLGFTAETVAESIDKWLQCGFYLCQLFRLNDLNLSVPEKARIYHFYVPVFLWCEDQLLRHRSKFNDGDEIPPLVIGVSAPQGSGKTTLVFALEYLFRRSGRTAATLSIDDFYLTAEDQAKLRSKNPGNALLEFRGNAGSHDLQFSIDTLTSLSKLTKKGMKMKLPRYDKSANGGRGDRADPSTWPEVEGPTEVVLFEGWMLGFKPLPNEVVKAVDPQLEVVNKNLEAYFDAWDKFVEAWIIIKIMDPNCVYQWRLQAEVAMREDGKPGMSDEEMLLEVLLLIQNMSVHTSGRTIVFKPSFECFPRNVQPFLDELDCSPCTHWVVDFVSRYLPAYKAYLPPLYSEEPKGLDPDRLLVIEIDEERNPMAEK